MFLRFLPLSLAILAFHFLWVLPTQASNCRLWFNFGPSHTEQRLKIEADPLKQLQTNFFRTNRPLFADSYPSYDMDLAYSALPRLRRLTEEDHWVDMGAGEGRAILQYLQDPTFPRKAKVTAIAFKKPVGSKHAEIESIDPGFRYLEGFVEEMTREQIGSAKLITDVYGPLHYTKNFSEVLQVYVDLLQEGGEILTSGIFFHKEAATNFVIKSDGAMISYREWLNSIPGLKVTEIPKPEIGLSAALVIEKIAPEVKVPKLKLVRYESGSPPRRNFEVVD